MPARPRLIDLNNRIAELTAQLRLVTKELYFPIQVRGVYISPNRDTSEGIISMTVERLALSKDGELQPVPPLYAIRLSNPAFEGYKPEDMVNMHGRVGVRLPGVFVAPEEVETPIVITWTPFAVGMKKTVVRVEDQTDEDRVR
ncbi:hypothetical protein J4E93_001054 [Alternaria ventricosa]|uniref:uncharacterized protein n=1 Tax=Alternaria ventricosa TaxID=1187951 RepID=UPI0020C307D5|nr:uncharacterized protein J4E93_001054 [Alternaria ventricosa]KAI4653292.1 hypothetical protein J4E93_001054 [Alternaria ventricosa]